MTVLNTLLPQPQAASGIILGQAIPMSGALNWFKDGYQEFLRTGVLKAYEPKYAPYAARMAGACYIDALPNFVRTGYNVDNSANADIFWNGTHYVLLNTSGSGPASAFGQYTTALTVNWSNFGASPSATTQVQGPYAFGQRNGGIINMLHRDASSCPVWHLAAGATAWTLSFGVPANTFPQGISYKTDGSLGAIVMAALTTAANGVYTSVDGITWTGRTGTGGTAFSMLGVHWSPAANAFLTWGGSSSSLYINKSTDGFNFTAAYQNTAGSVGIQQFADAYAGQQQWASSPTVSLMLLNNGLVLRTTDGVSFSLVDLKTQNGAYQGAGYMSTAQNNRIAYDSVLQRFVLTNTANGQMLFSLDGITWTPGFITRDAVTSAAAFGLIYRSVNSRNVLLMVNSNSLYGATDVTAKMASRAPDWIGGAAVNFGTTAPNAYTRIL